MFQNNRPQAMMAGGFAPQFNPDSLKTYVVTYEQGWNLGQLDLNLKWGDEFQYVRGTLIYFGQIFNNVQGVEAAYAHGWIALKEGQEPDPIVERLKDQKIARDPVLQRKLQRQRAMEQRKLMLQQQQNPFQAQGMAPPQTSQDRSAILANGVQTLNGVEVLPDNWKDLDWVAKRAYVNNMKDADFLEELLEDEEEKVQKIIKKRIEAINSGLADDQVVHTAPQQVISSPTSPPQNYVSPNYNTPLQPNYNQPVYPNSNQYEPIGDYSQNPSKYKFPEIGSTQGTIPDTEDFKYHVSQEIAEEDQIPTDFMPASERKGLSPRSSSRISSAEQDYYSMQSAIPVAGGDDDIQIEFD